MGELDPEQLATVQLVPPTPFSEDGERVVPERLEELLRYASAVGIRVFLPAAGTGEFHSLTVEEIAACVSATRNAVGADAIVAGPVGLGLPHAFACGQAALDAGADALMAMPPVHPYLSDSGLRDYYRRLMKRFSVPFLLYKRGPTPSDDLLAELIESDQIAGIKYALGDINSFTRFAQRCGGKTSLSCGLAERYAPAFMAAGATGFTSGAGNICPRLSLAIHGALVSEDYQQAQRRLEILRPIEDYRARDGDSFNVGMLKAGLRFVGHDFGPVRPPMRNIAESEEQEIQRLLLPILEYESAMTHSMPSS